MKRSVLLLTVLFAVSGCARESGVVLNNTLPQNYQQIGVLSAEDRESENIINENKPEISSIAETLFRENFSDDIKDDPGIRTNNVTVLRNAQDKGGLLFRLLNKSWLAQKAGYLIADYPVRSKFNKKSKQDNLAPISDSQIKELLSVLKPGDLILCGNNDSFVHAIVYLGDEVIIHALATKVSGGQKFLGVVKETLPEYLKRNDRDKFVVLRYKNLDTNELTKVFNYANQQVGKSYDTLFLMNSDSRFYCTELVFQSIMQLTNPPRIRPHKAKFGWQLITNEDFMASPDLETVWTLNYKRPALRI